MRAVGGSRPSGSRPRTWLRLIGLLSVAAFLGATGADLPVSAFTDDPELGLISISPTGAYLARAKRDGEFGTFQVVTYPEREVKINYGLGRHTEVGDLAWIGDDRLLITSARFVPFMDLEIPIGELHVVEVESGKMDFLVRGAALMHRLPDDADHVLILRYENLFAEAHRMDVKNGHLRRIGRSATRGGHLLANAAGEPEFSIGTNDEFVSEVRHRPKGDDWRVLGTARFGGEAWSPLLPGPKPDLWYTLDSRDAATTGFGIYDTDGLGFDLVIRHPTVDITDIAVDDDNRPWAVRFDHHYPAYQYLNPAHPLAQQHAALAGTYPDATVAITSSTRDNRLSVALVTGDREPGRFVLLDVADRHVEHLADRYPDLAAADLATMSPVEFQVRDGATVYGYVTSASATPEPGPMVVLVHGGPHGIRDYWGYDPHVQLLASRGYHVLQVNFRGSGGYGHAYMRRGFGEWGALMQDDVTDATRWAIDTGLADRGRVCIMGSSYGAYAALMGAAREPGLYRCAIGMAGIYDLKLLERAGDVRARLSGIHYIRQIMGDVDLDTRSPAKLAGRIRAKVMLVHGGIDRRAPPAHGRRMREALERAGNEVTWLFDADQGHGFIGNEVNEDLYARILKFLAENTGRPGAAEPTQPTGS